MVFVLSLDSLSQCHGPTVSDRPWCDLFQCPLQRVTVLDNERDPHCSDSLCHTHWPWQPHCVANGKDRRRDREKEEILYGCLWVYPKMTLWPSIAHTQTYYTHKGVHAHTGQMPLTSMEWNGLEGHLAKDDYQIDNMLWSFPVLSYVFEWWGLLLRNNRWMNACGSVWDIHVSMS